jgi:hypothetical protein
MSNLLSLGIRIPRLYWRVQRDMFRRVLARRRKPTPERLQNMTAAQYDAYARSVGMDVEIRQALTEYEEGKSDRTRLDPPVQASERSAEQRRGSPVA